MRKILFKEIYIYYFNLNVQMGIGDWGLGIGDWGLGIGPNPQYRIIQFLNHEIIKFKNPNIK